MRLTTVLLYFGGILFLELPRVGKWDSLHVCGVKNCTGDSSLIFLINLDIYNSTTIWILSSYQMFFKKSHFRLKKMALRIPHLAFSTFIRLILAAVPYNIKA